MVRKTYETSRKAFSVTGYLRDGSDFLLAKHRRLGLWLPPGGEIEQNESPTEALWRELREEIGEMAANHVVLAPPTGSIVVPASKIGSGTPHGLRAFELHEAGSKGIHMNFVFLGALRRGIPLVLSTEHDLFAWTPADSPLEIPPNVREIMQRMRFAWPEGR